MSGAPLAVVGFLGAHAVGDEAGPFALPEVFETMRTADFNTDDFGHAGVMMIGHCDGKCDLDIRAFGDQSKAVDEGVVGVVIGAQKGAPLGTTAGDHVVTTGHDLARERHS